MKAINIFCLCIVLLTALTACRQKAPSDDPVSTEESVAVSACPEVTDDIPTEAQTETLTEPETEAWETVAPAPAVQIHEAAVHIKAEGEKTVAVTDLMIGMEKGKTHVKVTPPLGYVCEGFVYDGTLYKGDLIPLSIIKKDAVTLRISYATLELPIVNISVEGQEITSKTEYVSMTFSLENTEDMMVAVPGGIRLRGNSTAGMPKKPYRIKFEQKQALFGLEKAKSWVLLAEYLDPSCLHNYAAMYLGAASDELAFTPTVHHVNLYLDGEYMGIYSLCEQVEEERLGIEKEITPSMRELMDFSFLVCMDERAPEEEEPFFFLPSVGRYFQLAYPDREDFANQRQFDRFMSQLEAYYNDMADAFRQGNQTWFRKNLNTDTLVDHIIIDQIMGEEDHIWKSFYSYHDATDKDRQGKISFGPIWDYDYSLYTPWTGEPNECYDIDTAIAYSNFFFQGLMGSRYETKVTARYDQHYAAVLEALIDHLKEYRKGMETSLALNQARWYSYDPHLTEDNFDFMIRFFKSRQKVLGKAWG